MYVCMYVYLCMCGRRWGSGCWTDKTIENTKKNKKTKISEPMGSQNHREYKKNFKKTRFQNQWVAKTIENTKKNKKTKISEPMGSQNHREYQKNQKKQVLRWDHRSTNLPTKILDLRGFDSSIISMLRGGILMSIGNFPESLSQAILVGTMLVGRLTVIIMWYTKSNNNSNQK